MECESFYIIKQREKWNTINLKNKPKLTHLKKIEKEI